VDNLFRLGVNYWPQRKAMYWWSNFERDEVRHDFALIKSLGLEIVRIFLLWDDFQPTPYSVSVECLQHLETVCDLAAEQNLKLDITFFTGHMSGPNWSPQWLLNGPIHPMFNQLVSGGRVVEGGYRNPYEDQEALDAAKLLLVQVVRRLRQHPGVWMWNLGNEPDLFAHPSTAEIGHAWVRNMTHLIHDLDDQHLVTCGLHTDSLLNNNGLRVDQVFAETDIAVMHAYPMFLPYAKHPLDSQFVPFSCALAQALCGKPILMEEFGGCTAAQGSASNILEWTSVTTPRTQFMASEEDFAGYLSATLNNLLHVGATGAMVWCFADYAPELWDRPPCSDFHHERSFGLIRPDRSLKPHAQVLQKFAAANPVVQTQLLNTVHLDITPDEYYLDPASHFVRLYDEFLQTIKVC
jgi:endo-1,4-beta-mannosidase